MPKTIAIVVVILCGSSSFVHATPFFYDNGAPNHLSGAEMTQWVEADDFTLTDATTLTGIRFWNVQDDVRVIGTTYQGSISWQIFTNNAIEPGTVVASGTTAAVTRSATGHSLPPAQGSLPEFQHDFALPSVALSPGTYWLALHNGPLTTETFQQFYWESTNPNATLIAVNDIAPFDGGWMQNPPEASQLAFQLFGDTGSAAAVPEPASLLLLGAGVLGVARHKVRRR